MIFPTYISSSFGSNRNICFFHDDGALDIYVYYIVNCRDSRGQNICWPMQLAVQKLCCTSQKLCQKCLNLPRHRKEVPVKHMFWAAKTYVLPAQNICFKITKGRVKPETYVWRNIYMFLWYAYAHFQHTFRRVWGQTETYMSRFGRLLIHDGALGICIYYIV